MISEAALIIVLCRMNCKFNAILIADHDSLENIIEDKLIHKDLCTPAFLLIKTAILSAFRARVSLLSSILPVVVSQQAL